MSHNVISVCLTDTNNLDPAFVLALPRGLAVCYEPNTSHHFRTAAPAKISDGENVGRFMGVTMSPILNQKQTHQAIVVAGLVEVCFDHKNKDDNTRFRQIGEPVYVSTSTGEHRRGRFTFKGGNLNSTPVGYFVQSTEMFVGKVMLQRHTQSLVVAPAAATAPAVISKEPQFRVQASTASRPLGTDVVILPQAFEGSMKKISEQLSSLPLQRGNQRGHANTVAYNTIMTDHPITTRFAAPFNLMGIVNTAQKQVAKMDPAARKIESIDAFLRDFYSCSEKTAGTRPTLSAIIDVYKQNRAINKPLPSLGAVTHVPLPVIKTIVANCGVSANVAIATAIELGLVCSE